MVKPLALYAAAAVGILALGGTLVVVARHRSPSEDPSHKSEMLDALQLAPTTCVS